MRYKLQVTILLLANMARMLPHPLPPPTNDSLVGRNGHICVTSRVCWRCTKRADASSRWVRDGSHAFQWGKFDPNMAPPPPAHHVDSKLKISWRVHCFLWPSTTPPWRHFWNQTIWPVGACKNDNKQTNKKHNVLLPLGWPLEIKFCSMDMFGGPYNIIPANTTCV